MRMVNARRSTGSHHRQRLAGRCGLDPDPAPLRGASHLRHFANAGLGRSSQRHRRCGRTGRCDSVPAAPSSWALVASSAEGLASRLARSVVAAGGHVASEHRRHHSHPIADAMIPSRATAVRGRRFACPRPKPTRPCPSRGRWRPECGESSSPRRRMCRASPPQPRQAPPPPLDCAGCHHQLSSSDRLDQDALAMSFAGSIDGSDFIRCCT